jgi:hypothetical protein
LVVRYLLAFLFFGHGIAHLPGFLVAWQIRSMPELPYTTTVLGGTVDLGFEGTRALGVAWLLACIVCAGVAAGILLRLPWWTSLAWATLGLSCVLCILGWPAARFGLLVSIALGVLLAAGLRRGWFA